MNARPGLGVISFAQNAGGVAYVARLLRRALRDAGADPWLVDLGVERRDAAKPWARARFVGRLLEGSLRRRADWMLFNHMAVARAHHAIPGAIRLPYGIFVHDIEAWDPDLDPDRVATLQDAAVIISNSAYTARRVESAHGGRLAVAACPLGLLDEPPAPGTVDRALLDSCGARSVLVVGRMMADERYKGHDQLLDVWPSVIAMAPDARLLMAGWGNDIARLKEKASALGVAHAVIFCGYVNEATLAALFERIAVYAMPSAREGFGLVYLEAMRAAVPCIGSTLDAAGEVIAHGETGFVVDRADPRELSAALGALLSDPAKRAAMGAAGRRRYRTNFTYGHFRDRLLPILDRAFPGFAVRSAVAGRAIAMG